MRRSEAAGDRILVNGNSAAALGCVYAGATVAAWYPITPSTSLVDAFASHCERLRVDSETGVKNFAVVQAEDELAAIGMAIGACWNGARGFTATSGPGISLMTEFLGLAYFAEIPVVLFDIQRGSPSTGMPTRTQQADLLSCAYASHGDTKHVLLFPKDPTEAFELAATAFDLAERIQTPVIVMSDLDLGMNDWTTDPFRWDDARRYDRGKQLDAEGLERMKDWGRYLDVDGDGIPWRTIPATHPDRGAYLVRGTSHDEYARYTEDGEVYLRSMERIARKFETAARARSGGRDPRPAENDTLVGVVYFGTTSAAMEEALEVLRADGVALDALRIRAFPFGPRGVRLHRPSHRRCSWWSRTGTRRCAPCSSTRATSTPPGSSPCCTTTGSRSRARSSRTRSASASLRTPRCEEEGARRKPAPSPGSRLNGRRNASRGTAGPNPTGHEP